MTQIFCITAYKEFDYLISLVQQLIDEECFVYVHIDKKNVNEDVLNKLNSIPHTTAISVYRIPWGGIQHIEAIISLIKFACNDHKEDFYLHVITGQDCLCKKKSELKKFFCKDNDKNYMSCSDKEDSHFRFKVFYRNDLLNYKSPIGKLLTKISYVVQRILFINRKPPFNYKIHKGMVYVSITKAFSNYIVSFLGSKEGSKFFSWLKWTFVPEEFFFQTILMNSPLCNTCVNNNFRFALWKEKHGCQPGILDENDFETIKISNYFFARKISSIYSDKLLNKLNNE